MRRLTRYRPSPAMAVAFVALFAAFAGGAIALPGNNTVTSGDIVNNTIKSKDIKNRTIKSRDVKRNSLGGAAIREDRLGQVPDAAHADAADTATAATSASNAVNAANLGGVAAAAYARKGHEAVHVVGAAGQPAFNTGWANNNNFGPPSPFQVAGFWKDAFGVVHLQGDLERNSGTAQSPFTLPAGYRPAGRQRFVTIGGSDTNGNSVLRIETTGQLNFFGLPGSPDSTALNGITFLAGN